MRVTVTVDDLGMAEGIGESCRRLLDLGSVHRLSILTTGRFFEEASEIAWRSDAGISVHLNCVQPPFITDADFPDSHTAWLTRGKKYAGQVEAEWRAQIEKALNAGLTVTGLDSHQHLHNLPFLRKCMVDLALEYGAGLIRVSVIPERWRSPVCFLLDAMGRRTAALARKRGIPTPDLMLGFSRSGRVSRKYLDGMESKLAKEGTAELVMHPSVEPVWSRHQPEEHRLLASDWFGKWLKEH